VKDPELFAKSLSIRDDIQKLYNPLLGFANNLFPSIIEMRPQFINHLKTSLVITIGVAILVIASKSDAVSFNCAEASTLVEKMICSEKRLSDLDDLLAHSYKNAISNITDNNALKIEQRAWIKNSRNK
jgi:hypothetical protein